MTRKPRPKPDQADPDLSLAITAALANAAPFGGATSEALAEAIRICWGLDVSSVLVGRAMVGLLLHGKAELVPGASPPTYLPRQLQSRTGRMK